MSRNWTPSQQQILATRNKTVLVSASSGSGKTTVMINLVADMIAKGANISEFLVTTFTNAAAADMKEKLFSELIARRENSSSALEKEHISRQIGELDTADIGTLHKFCGDLIRKYYYAAGCDPAFSIIDQTEIERKMRRAALELIKKRKERGDKDFERLYDMFARRRRPDNLIRLLKNVYNFCRSLGEWERWLDEAAENNGKNIEIYTQKYYTLARKHFLQEADRLESKAKQCSFAQAELLAQYVKDLFKKPNFYIPLELNFPRMPDKKTLDSRQLALLDYITALRDNARSFFNTCLKGMLLPTDFESKKLIKSLVSAVKEFGQNFASLKKDDYELDFSDLEHTTLNILKNNPDIKAEVQNRYKYVFVDEYQDINPVQDMIISHIARPNNLFMVGDLKQSIYRFRLCDPDIFWSKFHAFKNGEVKDAVALELNDNFRSVKPILDFCNEIFSRIMTEDLGGIDYRQYAMLKGNKEGDGKRVKINLIKYGAARSESVQSPTGVYSVKGHVFSENAFNPASAEAYLIAEEIQNLIENARFKNPDGSTRRAEYSDIVILCRSMTEYTLTMAKKLAEYLPVKLPPSEDLSEAEEIKYLLDYIRVLDNLKNDIPFAGVLRGPFCGLTDDELAEIRKNYPKEYYYFEAALKYSKKFDSPAASKIKKLLENIERHRTFAQCHNSYDLLRQIIKDCDFMTLMLQLPDGQAKCDNVCSFLDAVSTGRYNCPVWEFARYIEEGLAQIKATESAQGGQCVRIMTMHSSKGLEFPIVIVAGMGCKYKNDADEVKMDKELYIGLNNYDPEKREIADSGIKNTMSKKSRHRSREDEMRVLYVALTRAEQYLILTAAINDKYKAPALSAYSLLKAQRPIDFILAVVARDKTHAKDFGIEETLDIAACYELDITEVEEIFPVQKTEPKVASAPKELINYFKEGLDPLYQPSNVKTKYSVTELSSQNADDYMPVKIFTNEEDEPFWQGGTDLGNAYHYAMYHIDKNADDLARIEAEIERMKNQGILTTEQAGYIDPQKILKCLNTDIWKTAKATGNRYYLEQPFIMYVSAREVLNIPSDDKTLVQGVIDLLILTPEGAIILDYKTTKADRHTLINLYKNQIDLYAEAAQKILGKNIVGKYIYSFYLDKLVNV